MKTEMEKRGGRLLIIKLNNNQFRLWTRNQKFLILIMTISVFMTSVVNSPQNFNQHQYFCFVLHFPLKFIRSIQFFFIK